MNVTLDVILLYFIIYSFTHFIISSPQTTPESRGYPFSR